MTDDVITMATADDFEVSPDNFVKVSGAGLGKIKDGCLIIRDRRITGKRGKRYVAIPLDQLMEQAKLIESESEI